MKMRKRRTRAPSEFLASDLIYKHKSCEVCSKKHNEANMVLCDRCEDAYHIRCIGLDKVPKDDFICEECKRDMQKLRQTERTTKKPILRNIIEECRSCKQKVGQVFNFSYEGDSENTIFQAKNVTMVRCAYCGYKYHSICFSQRSTSINCSDCQRTIRELIPKGFQYFRRYVQDCREEIARMNYIQLAEGLAYKSTYEPTALPQMNLLSPPQPKDWRVLVTYFASTCYALMTRGMTIAQNLLVEVEPQRIQMVIRAHAASIIKVCRLHRSDEAVYTEYKSNLQQGYVPPLQVRQDRKKGFFLVARDLIRSNTIISQYAGELVSARESLNMIHNESIFTLLRNPRSQHSLDIVPNKFANVSIFISGINNEKDHVSVENVRAIKFIYKGIVRLILVAIRDIKAGETLYLNYNGDQAVAEYPTNDFVH